MMQYKVNQLPVHLIDFDQLRRFHSHLSQNSRRSSYTLRTINAMGYPLHRNQKNTPTRYNTHCVLCVLTTIVQIMYHVINVN